MDNLKNWILHNTKEKQETGSFPVNPFILQRQSFQTFYASLKLLTLVSSTVIWLKTQLRLHWDNEGYYTQTIYTWLIFYCSLLRRESSESKKPCSPRCVPDHPVSFSVPCANSHTITCPCYVHQFPCFVSLPWYKLSESRDLFVHCCIPEPDIWSVFTQWTKGLKSKSKQLKAWKT